jgi:hypothetical protein
MIFEIFAKSQPEKLSNFNLDPIECLFFNISNEKAKFKDKS